MIDCKLVLFDVDDTLYNSKACWTLAVKATLREFEATSGLATEALFAVFDAYSDKYWALYEQKRVTMQEYRNMRFLDAMKEFGHEVPPETAEAFNARFMGRALDYMERDEALLAFLRDLAGQCKIGVITNGPTDQQQNKIERLGLGELFPPEQVFISGNVGFHKPDARIFEHALEYFGVDAQDAMYVGDSWSHDVLGAMRVGMQAVWVNPSGKEQPTEDRPFAIVEKVTDLRRLLDLAPTR